MKKHGDIFTTLFNNGYQTNLHGKSAEELQSTYFTRRQDGRTFMSSQPTINHYNQREDLQYSSVDDTRFFKDKELVKDLNSGVRLAMADIHRRGPPKDKIQLSEEMVSRDEEEQTMTSLYTRMPEKTALDRQLAIRMNGKRETANDFDFENQHEGGLALRQKHAGDAKEIANRLQMKRYIDKIRADTEGNAQDYYGRNNLNVENATGSSGQLFENVWVSADMEQEARFNSTSVEKEKNILTNLHTMQILSADCTSFVPARLVEKVASMGASGAETTMLTELLASHFGRAKLNASCSTRELLNIIGKADEIAATNPRINAGTVGERAQIQSAIFLSKVSQLFSARPKITSMENISRISEEYNIRENTLTMMLNNGEISRPTYNMEMYKTMTKYHGAVLKAADFHFRSGIKNEKLSLLLKNAVHIFELWASDANKMGISGLSYREVEAMKNIMAFNNEMLMVNRMANTNSPSGSGTTELFLKEYVQELENLMRYSNTFDRNHPGVRADYKREYIKLSEDMDTTIAYHAPKALQESSQLLIAKYMEVQNDSRIPIPIKQKIIKSIDLALAKTDALIGSSGSGIMSTAPYEMRNLADSNAKLEQEITSIVSSKISSHGNVVRENALNNPTALAHQQFAVQNNFTKNCAENRGELSWKTGKNEIINNQSIGRREVYSEKPTSINVLRQYEHGVRNNKFKEGTTADIIANSIYTPAFSGNDLPTEIIYNKRW